MDFSIPKELNVHFDGGPENDPSKLRLRYLKAELRENQPLTTINWAATPPARTLTGTKHPNH